MIILELHNWQESRVAFLEVDNDSIYLYSYPNDKEREIKSLWVANTKKRFLNTSTIEKDLEKGNPPYLPNKLCNSNGFILDFSNEKNWRLQWGLDQNSVAVWFKNNIVAVMPEWSGVNGFYGYSIGTDFETLVAWPLLPSNIQINRFLKENEFLKNWSETTWINHQENLLKIYDSSFAGNSKYFAADDGKWPPLGIRYSVNEKYCNWTTVGLSQLPMPLLGMNHSDDEIEDYRRIELSILIEKIEDIHFIGKYLSAQAKYPWYWCSHFDHGHTIPCAELAKLNSKMSYMFILSSAKFLPQISTPKFIESKTRILFMVPIYESEQIFAEKNSSADLISLLEKSINPLSINREKVV